MRHIHCLQTATGLLDQLAAMHQDQHVVISVCAELRDGTKRMRLTSSCGQNRQHPAVILQFSTQLID
jgi:hypothetical protein